MPTSVALVTAPLEQARRAAGAGDKTAARAWFRQALQRYGSDPDVLTEFGAFESEAGQHAAAQRLLEKAVKLAPRDPALRVNLGEALRRAGAVEGAIRQYRKALELAPDDANALYCLGDALRERGRCSEALPYLERAVALAPNDIEAFNALGLALEKLGRASEAVTAFRRAVELDPSYRPAVLNLAAALQERDDHEEADRLFAGAAAVEPLPASFLAIWARALSGLNREAEAEQTAQSALAADPALASAHLVIGEARKRLGDFDAAETAFRKAQELDPDQPRSYAQLAAIRRLGCEAIPRLRQMLADAARSPVRRSQAGFALYHLLDQQGDVDGAFAALAGANALRAQEHPFDRERFARRAERIIATFGRSFFAARAGQGYDRAGLVYVLGMPRSGTTLTEQILAHYRDVHAGGERGDLGQISRAIGNFPEGALDLEPGWARQAGERLYDALFAGADGARFATDKAPGNYQLIGLIAWLLPRARIVYCRRDPRDVAFSCFEQNFHAGLSFSFTLESIAAVSKLHERLMRHWLEVSPVPIHTVDYEALVSEPEPTARALVEFIGLDWDPACIDTNKVARPIKTASVWQVRQPIRPSSVGKWRRYEKHLPPLLAALEQP